MGSSVSCHRIPYIVDDVKSSFPTINDEATFGEYVKHCKKTGHMKLIREYLDQHGYINENGKLHTGSPFNVFARYASGAMNTHVDQSIIDGYNDDWVICHNKPENDMNWKDVNNKQCSMCGPDENGPGHVFITTKKLDWKYFNVLTVVLSGEIEFLMKLKEVATEYVRKRGWKKYGFYFHCLPHNSVNSLHLHVCNEENPGHMLTEMSYKNLPLESAIAIALKKK